jgi:hypothetical protein
MYKCDGRSHAFQYHPSSSSTTSTYYHQPSDQLLASNLQPPTFNMQFTTAFLASAAALTATAMPQTTPISGTDRFQVITIRSGSPIQNAPLQAAQRHLFVGVKSQNATCDTRDEVNSATFYISNEELVLHSRHPSPQTIYVDRSGMGK